MSNLSKRISRDPISAFLSINLIALYGFLILIAYAINLRTGLHALICLGIFAGSAYITARFIPFKWQIRLGMLIMSILLFAVLTSFEVDKIWSIFWVGSYLAGTYYSQKNFNSFDDFREKIANLQEPADPPKVSSRSAQSSSHKAEKTYHKKVGNCRGENTQTSTNFSHDLLKCGNCATAGCAEMYCSKRNFQGNVCMTCNTRANPL